MYSNNYILVRHLNINPSIQFSFKNEIYLIKVLMHSVKETLFSFEIRFHRFITIDFFEEHKKQSMDLTKTHNEV